MAIFTRRDWHRYNRHLGAEAHFCDSVSTENGCSSAAISSEHRSETSVCLARWTKLLNQFRRCLASGGGFLGRRHWRLEEDLKARKEVLARVNRENVSKLVDANEVRDAGVKPLDVIWMDTQESGPFIAEKTARDPASQSSRPKKQGKVHTVTVTNSRTLWSCPRDYGIFERRCQQSRCQKRRGSWKLKTENCTVWEKQTAEGSSPHLGMNLGKGNPERWREG